MEKIKKVIQWILRQIIEYKFVAILAFLGSLAMTIVSFLSTFQLPIQILIVLACLGTLIWTMIGLITFYRTLPYPKVLEIIYDNGRYNGEGERKDDLGFYYKSFAYRIGIYNNSNKTIHSVFVKARCGETEIYCSHELTRSRICDINPRGIEIFTLGYKVNNCDPSGEIFIITASGKDVTTITRTITL